MPYRPEFRSALDLLAQAMAELSSKGIALPVLVGGAAVELYTGGAVASGDFDFVSPHQDACEKAFEGVGFRRILEPGFLTRSLIHRELGFGVQIVSGLLMDGRADPGKIVTFEVEGIGKIRAIPAEDLIADRMGQAYSSAPPRKDMLDQAFKLLELVSELDRDYLGKRIREETDGSASLSTLERWVP
jgi:hypothetical protein